MVTYKKSIWWIKRDFRLHDNKPLFEALRQSHTVLPVFVYEPSLLNAPETSPLHINAQLTALKALQKSLRKLGADVCFLTDDLPTAFARLHMEYQFETIFSHQETGSNITYQRDLQVKQWCKEQSIHWVEYPQNAVIRGRKIDKLDKKMWGEFMHERQAPVPTSFVWNSTMQRLCQTPIPPVPTDITVSKLQPVTESAAHRILDSFFDSRGLTYWGSISSPNTAWLHGSRLSPHIAWGTISLRQVFQTTQIKMKEFTSHSQQQWLHSLTAFSSRLYWHDHFMQKLESFPELEYEVSDKRYTNISYEDNDERLQSWLTGTTGFPMVDATMRCLRQTGFVNFRMRAMAISFATFGLHLSWKKIMYPFAKLMADYEPGIHIYQVQMQSGVTKGQSMRVYNPIKQMLEKDINCDFIKKWIPELQSFSPTEIYRSLLTSETYGTANATRMGSYPTPLVHWKKMNGEMKEQILECRGRKKRETMQMSLSL